MADFGESRHFEKKAAMSRDDMGLSMTMVGTHLYCAPEASFAVFLLPSARAACSDPRPSLYAPPQIVTSQVYNTKCDVFSFGLVLLEVLIGDCTWVKRRFRGVGCYAEKEEGGMGFRPPIPDEVLAADPPNEEGGETRAEIKLQIMQQLTALVFWYQFEVCANLT